MVYVWHLELTLQAEDKVTAYETAAKRLRQLAQEGPMALAHAGGLIVVGGPSYLQPVTLGGKGLK